MQAAGEARLDADHDHRTASARPSRISATARRWRGLADAARCRSESDWLIGINGTRALTKRMFGSRAGNVASVGRVQTPTLAIVYARELEIRNFKPRAFWRVTATFAVAKGPTRASISGRTSRRPRTTSTTGSTASGRRRWPRPSSPPARAPARRRHGGKEGQHPAAPRLYDLTTLQREANNRFGLPARRTLQIAQALYERHKMITYPRTDSRALPEDYIPTVRQTLANLSGDLAGPRRRRSWTRAGCGPTSASSTTRRSPTTSPSFPRRPSRSISTSMEAKIFDMIARRFVAAFYPPAEFDITTRT